MRESVKMLRGHVPVDGVQYYGARDDGVNVDIGLPQSCHHITLSQQVISVNFTCGRNQSGVEDRCTERKGRVAAHTSS